MDYQRFNQKRIKDGTEAQSLLDTPIFEEAVNRVLSRYAEIEEKLVLDDSQDVREITAKIKHFAMMRRAVIDVCDELSTLARIGRDAELGD